MVTANLAYFGILAVCGIAAVAIIGAYLFQLIRWITDPDYRKRSRNQSVDDDYFDTDGATGDVSCDSGSGDCGGGDSGGGD